MGKTSITASKCVTTIALLCHCLHYAKRLYETQFVHRFSNGTMPQRNLFKVKFLKFYLF
jgi:very-long-chain enoyl-CoA reductase